MQEFVDFANSNGFNIANPLVDGKIHRFTKTKKNDCWYIGFLNESASGKKYLYGIIGDWRSGVKFEFKPKGCTKEERAHMASQLKEASETERRAKEERQAQASKRAEQLWSQAKPVGTSDYLTKKKISLSGARTYLDDCGRIVLVPCFDIAGKLWGIQKIYPDGKKLFLSGQRITGTFFQIGNLGDTFYICEGYATGATIHEATGLGVLCAFNAANLKHVAVELRKAHPKAKIIICGDDDVNTEGNPGRRFAEDAAKASHAICVYPDISGGGSDFNDSGLALTKKVLCAVKKTEALFYPLGFEGGTDYFFSTQNKTIVECTTYNDAQFLRLAPKDYWAGMFQGEKGKISWLDAKDYLISLSRSYGRYNPEKIRGTGVWLDSGKTVVNTGKVLIHEANFKPSYTYIETKNHIPKVHSSPLPIDEAKWLLDACTNLHWREEKHGHLLAGWLAIARIAGALPIRPHVWVTGGSGTGKSTLMGEVVKKCLGHGCLYVQGGSTEAGIRQHVKADAIPLIFDEFETLEGAGSSERVQKVLELLRQTWSYSEGSMIKGSAGGTATQFSLSFAALVSSVRVALTNDADRSRFSVLKLSPHGNDKEHWLKYKQILKHITVEYGERLFSRSVKLVDTILASYDVFADELAGVVSRRFGQQHGMILAGLWSLYSDTVVPRETAVDMVKDLDFSYEKESAGITDEIDCLINILTSKVRLAAQGGVYAVERSIGEILRGDDLVAIADLVHYGIVVDNEYIYVSNSNKTLKDTVFKDTHWKTNWSDTLERLPGALRVKSTKRFGDKHTSKCVKIPITLINEY